MYVDFPYNFLYTVSKIGYCEFKKYIYMPPFHLLLRACSYVRDVWSSRVDLLQNPWQTHMQYAHINKTVKIVTIILSMLKKRGVHLQWKDCFCCCFQNV